MGEKRARRTVGERGREMGRERARVKGRERARRKEEKEKYTEREGGVQRRRGVGVNVIVVVLNVLRPGPLCASECVPL